MLPFFTLNDKTGLFKFKEPKNIDDCMQNESHDGSNNISAVLPCFSPNNTFNRGKMKITLAYQGCLWKLKNPVEFLF